MNEDASARLEAAGMTAGRAAAKRALFTRAGAGLDAIGAQAAPVPLFVPGRIEVLGKHTDYAGGRSLLCAAEQGFALLVAPRRDGQVRVIDAMNASMVAVALDAEEPSAGRHWASYAAAVARRLASSFPSARRGCDVAFASDLPPASGMSSSSALVVALALAVIRVNALEQDDAWRRSIRTREEMAAFLATIENGASFGPFRGAKGVGTFGGSEDHTAILCCRPGVLSLYSFCPVVAEGNTPFPAGHCFVIAVSGVVAEKTGEARERYNRASLAVRAILDGCARAGFDRESLAAVLRGSEDSAERVRALLRDAAGTGFSADVLLDRLDQFVEENQVIIPQAADALRRRDLASFGTLVDRSQRLAEEQLRNQVPETIWLARSARELGAAAASAFGAGFGGSVWALVRATDAAPFAARWATEYRARYPEPAARAQFIETRPGPAVTWL